jgi:hypothetical protein
LEFLLGETANPQPGNQFPILSAAGGVVGAFSSTVLPPLASGLAWTVLYNPTSVVLKVVSAPSFTADFDEDGDVDGNDLTNWKGGFGVGATHLQGNADGDADVDGADFLNWQRQLGSSPSAVASASIPEPSTCLLLAVAAGGQLIRMRQTRS